LGEAGRSDQHHDSPHETSTMLRHTSLHCVRCRLHDRQIDRLKQWATPATGEPKGKGRSRRTTAAP
jgi:hypothetical protein